MELGVSNEHIENGRFEIEMFICVLWLMMTLIWKFGKIISKNTTS